MNAVTLLLEQLLAEHRSQIDRRLRISIEILREELAAVNRCIAYLEKMQRERMV